jgi:acetyltransferase-like isoleucine patch superfamily enzyme
MGVAEPALIVEERPDVSGRRLGHCQEMNLEGLVQRYRRWQLARRGLRLDRSCFVDRMVSLGPRSTKRLRGTVDVGPECELGLGVELNAWGGRIRIQRHVFLGPYVVIYGHGGVEIGEDTLIAMHCCIVSSNHALAGRGRTTRHEPDIVLPTRIGRDVWLGAGVKVLGGVTIGDGCVVGAGAVVTHDLAPYSIAAGVPARVIGERK